MKRLNLPPKTKSSACWIWGIWFSKCPTPLIRNVGTNKNKTQPTLINNKK
jgi:hypothetical protein